MKTREELKQIRLAAGLTQAEVARKAGVSPKTLLKFENGRNVHPRIEGAIRDAFRELYMSNPTLSF
jgi:transcriptional regulator with XRE-family HTH domain